MLFEAFHRLYCPTSMVTHLCICSDNYIVMPLNEKGNIAVWNARTLSKKPSILTGHHKTVSALALSHQPTCHFLCSCSSDNIILWNLMQNGGQPTKGKVLHSHMEPPIYCSFGSDNSEIAVSFPNGLWVFDLKKNSWTKSVEGTCFTIFAFVKRDVLLGVEKNFLKTWHLESKETEIKVSVSTDFSTTLCVYKPNAIIIIGTACGHLYIFDMKYTLIRSIQIWKLVTQQIKCDSSGDGTFHDVKSDSFPIYSLQVFGYENFSNPDVYLLNPIYLLVVTSTCLFILEINNEEIIFYTDFNGYFVFDEIKTQIGLVRSSATACNADYSEACIILTPVLDESLILLKLSIRDIVLSKLNTENTKVEENKNILTFLTSNLAESDKSLLIPRIQKSNKSLRKISSNRNLPVTFHSNIKSSGYGKTHKPVILFQPQIPTTTRSGFKNSVSHEQFRHTTQTKKKNIYEIHESLNFENLELLTKKESFENPVLSSLQLTVDGEYICCTSSKGLIDIFKVKKKHLNIFRSITAHKEKINEAKWSHSKQLLITAGSDKMAKIWDLERQTPLLTIGVENNLTTAKEKHKFVFEDAVQQAQFYYLDHFILAAAGNKLHLFEYAINIQKSGIKSYLNTSSLKLIKKIPLETKRITSLAAMNQFFSNIVLCTGTSKYIDVLDMTNGKVICHIADTSTRPAHLISLNEGSPYTSQTSFMYDLFLTTSLFDGIKIWDLRTNRPVLCYKEHKCRSYPCDAVFSPCGKYVATGSENKSLYIYDLRQMSHCHKLLEPQVDVFTSVAFSPKSQLIASSLNGSIYLYGNGK